MAKPMIYPGYLWTDEGHSAPLYRNQRRAYNAVHVERADLASNYGPGGLTWPPGSLRMSDQIPFRE